MVAYASARRDGCLVDGDTWLPMHGLWLLGAGVLGLLYRTGRKDKSKRLQYGAI